MSKSRLTKRALFLLGFLWVSSVQMLDAQCLFMCNDTVNVSVNNMCMAIITPDIILEGVDVVPPGCTYGIELFTSSGQKINTSPKLGSQYVGQVIKVRLFQMGGSPVNSCWSYILLEDKLPPEIMCPPNDTIPCYDSDNALDEVKLRAHLKAKVEANLIDNCGNEDISISIISNTLDRDCAGPFSAVQIVVYDALDNSLNATRCVDTIYYERAPFADVSPPKNYKDNMALKCYGSWDVDGDGLPGIDELMSLDGDLSKPNIKGDDVRDYLLCNFKLTSMDQIFPDCGDTYKMVRTWTVIDWCNASNPKMYYQVIKVIDDRINATFPGDINGVISNPWTCEQQVTLPAPTVSADECSSWSWSISVREPGETELTSFGGSRGSNVSSASRTFPIGKSTVQYTVEDVCGNMRIDSFCVVVVDQDDPIAVCDYRTVVTLNDSYAGKAFAISFDDGSFDGCSDIVSYQVRRTDRMSTSCPTPQDFDDFVKFCCEDLGKTIMVELQVTDATGRTSVCMAEVHVQFKGIGPDIQCPPDPGIRDCRTYESFNINGLSGPTIQSSNPCLQGNMGTKIRETGRQIDECGDGFIDVEWTVNFTGTEQVICTERIVFTNLDPFDKFDINWPLDRNLTSCESLEPTVAEEANLFDKDRPCSNIFATHEDETFNNVSGFCETVLRKWTVIDWCQFNASTSNPVGIWSHVQNIRVVGSDDPVFALVPGIIEITEDQNNCRATVKATGQATDDCTEDNRLSWTYKLDVIFGNTAIPIIAMTSGRSFQRTLDIGTYLITWEVGDGCDNVTTKTQSFEVTDKQEPTAICRSTSGNLSFVTGQLTVLASQLNGGSSDNCDGDLEYRIRRAGSASAPTTQLIFSCSDEGVQEIELWVRDDAGNESHCTVFYEVRDDNNACGVAGASVAISGMLRTPLDEPIEDAEVRIENMATHADNKQMTPVSGEYAFEDLTGASDYAIVARKNNDYPNGVSTLDLILIQQHILGLRPFDSPYKYVAADANSDEKVSSIDLVTLRRLILGQTQILPGNESWKFFPIDHTFDNPTHPWPLQTTIELTDLAKDMATNDFTGVKIGDVDQNAVANSRTSKSRTNQQVKLFVAAENVIKNQLNYAVYLEDAMTVSGIQAAFTFDPDDLQFLGLASDQLDIQTDMYVVGDGTIKLSIADPIGSKYKDHSPIVRLVFRKVRENEANPPLGLMDWENELYDGELNRYNIVLKEKIGLTEEVVLFQNKPNPFSDETVIEFFLPGEGQAQLEIYNLNGSRVYELDGYYEAGTRRVTLNRSELGLQSGIYYYQLTTVQGALARKMIIMQ